MGVMSVKEAFARFIVEKRNSKNMRQIDVAEKANITQGYLSKIESGGLEPTLSNAMAICEALGVDLNDFKNRYI